MLLTLSLALETDKKVCVGGMWAMMMMMMEQTAEKLFAFLLLLFFFFGRSFASDLFLGGPLQDKEAPRPQLIKSDF